MKLIISAAALCLLLGTSAYAQQPDDKPKQEEPKKPEDTKKTEAPNKQEEAKKQESAEKARQDKQADKQEKDRSEQKTTAGRIPDDKFRSNFGSGHRFHVTRGDGQRFQYGGYGFAFSEPWPSGWSYDDYCYVDFIDGQYYLIDVVHPQVHLLLVVSL